MGSLKNIRFKSTVTNADWSSEERCWFIKVNQDGQEKQYRSRFIYTCTGYYDYHAALKADIPGIQNFKGKVVHPQFWDVTEDDYRGKRVAVIGSGATAITLIPSMANVTKDITLVQRSPTYILSLDKYDPSPRSSALSCPKSSLRLSFARRTLLVSMPLTTSSALSPVLPGASWASLPRASCPRTFLSTLTLSPSTTLGTSVSAFAPMVTSTRLARG